MSRLEGSLLCAGFFFLGMLLGCAPGPGAPKEVVSDAPACARSVDGRLIDVPCPTPNPDVRPTTTRSPR